MTDNPVADEDEYRLEVLIALRRIERLDKDEYNEDERQEAQDIYEQRRQEELQQEVSDLGRREKSMSPLFNKKS